MWGLCGLELRTLHAASRPLSASLRILEGSLGTPQTPAERQPCTCRKIRAGCEGFGWTRQRVRGSESCLADYVFVEGVLVWGGDGGGGGALAEGGFDATEGGEAFAGVGGDAGAFVAADSELEQPVGELFEL